MPLPDIKKAVPVMNRHRLDRNHQLLPGPRMTRKFGDGFSP